MKPVQTPRGKRFIPEENEHNLRIELSYNGTGFKGYQSQPHAKTVQDELMKAWSILTKETNPILYGCSRLDSGVHANHFVLNLHSGILNSQFRNTTALVGNGPTLEEQNAAYAQGREVILRCLNGIFSSNEVHISLHSLTIAEPAFNARFDAVGKHYRYLLWYGFVQNALLTPKCWAIKSRTPPKNLEHLFTLFEGEKNFAAYRASDCASVNPVRKIHSVKTWQHPRFAEMLVVDFWGEGFLKNMIRNICGTVVDCATGKLNEAQITESFEHGTRQHMGQCAPAHALTLEKVYYQQNEFLADANQGLPFFLH